jgi:hypothetical protein
MLRYAAVPFTNGAGYSKARMLRPRRRDNMGMTGALTMMEIKNASWFAGLETESSKERFRRMWRWRRLEHVLDTSRVTSDAMNKVPEEFTIYHPKVSRKNGVCFFSLGWLGL